MFGAHCPLSDLETLLGHGGPSEAAVDRRAPLLFLRHGKCNHSSHLYNFSYMICCDRWNHGNNENDWQSQLAAVSQLNRHVDL
jgi:hypothetical protein